MRAPSVSTTFAGCRLHLSRAQGQVAGDDHSLHVPKACQLDRRAGAPVVLSHASECFAKARLFSLLVTAADISHQGRKIGTVLAWKLHSDDRKERYLHHSYPRGGFVVFAIPAPCTLLATPSLAPFPSDGRAHHQISRLRACGGGTLLQKKIDPILPLFTSELRSLFWGTSLYLLAQVSFSRLAVPSIETLLPSMETPVTPARLS